MFENFRENGLNRDLPNVITVNPPLFSLVNTFNKESIVQACLEGRARETLATAQNQLFQGQKNPFSSLKGSWKREKVGVEKEANVRYPGNGLGLWRSRSIGIQFEHAVFD